MTHHNLQIAQIDSINFCDKQYQTIVPPSRNFIPRTSSFIRNYNTFTNHSIQHLPKRILIVDDEPYNIRGLTVQISQMGIEGISHIIDKAFNG